jgi:capsular polysaccharide export protein
MLKKTEPVGQVRDIVTGKVTSQHRVLCVTSEISEIKALDQFVGCPITHTPLMLNHACAVIVYGHGRPSRKAMSAVTGLEIDPLFTAQGPLHSHSHVKHKPLSMVFDDISFPYDAQHETYLTTRIMRELSADEEARAQRVIEAWRQAGASKYNEMPEPETSPSGRYVVVVEQSPYDVTLMHGFVDAYNHDQLVRLAERFHADCEVVTINDQVHPAGLIKNAEAVYTATSYIGFEALMWGTPVYVTGQPFYAGWGLTQDFIPARNRPVEVSLEQFVHGYLVDYARYVHPETGKRCEVEDILDILPAARREAVKNQPPKPKSFTQWFRR